MVVRGMGLTHAGPNRVKITSLEPATTGRRPVRGGVWFEAVVVLAAGVVFAFGANWISPRGLELSRNYFPGGTRSPALVATNATGTDFPVLSPAAMLASRLREQGMQVLDGHQAQSLFRDPRRQHGSLLFIDARDEEHYRKGHIPGAWEFDPYRPEKYFPAVFPRCQAADQIVIYCNGGDCDDSEAAAIALRDVGIATNKLFVYMGGMVEWSTNSLPVEIGGRDSGILLSTNKTR
jgi:rhodanese-related sulfurtransferase